MAGGGRRGDGEVEEKGEWEERQKTGRYERGGGCAAVIRSRERGEEWGGWNTFRAEGRRRRN